MKIRQLLESEGKFRSRASEEAVMDKETLMTMKADTVPDWEMLDHRILTAKYFAKNHRQAVEFVDFINRVSEYLDHFAEVTQDVAEVTVKTTTSDTNSLTILDFALAKTVDEYAIRNDIEQERIQGNFDEAAGVGIVTKQNATADVPVGGEYQNVKKLFPKKKKKRDEGACPRTRARLCECSSVNSLTESEDAVTAVCVLEHSDTVKGTILFKQTAGGPTFIAGRITGLEPGEHGFHIHQFGDMSQGCDSMGPHYDPEGVDHGDLDQGHVGDLGNITADRSGTATVKIVAERVDLTGDRSVVGRGIVVHADRDDLGKGGDEESLKTGNAGDRLACGVITLKETVNESISKLTEVDITIQQKSTDVLLSFLKRLTDAPMDTILKKAVHKELAKRGVSLKSRKTENLDRELKMRIQEILESTGGITDAWFKDGFKTFKKPAKEKYEIADADGTVKTLEGPVSYKKGYYIMTGPKGEQYPMPPEKFRELKDDHGNGVASSKKIIKTAKLADHDGSVNTSWGATLEYRKGQDYIVRHGANDYGVVKADIFQKTYDTSKANKSIGENKETRLYDKVARRLHSELIDASRGGAPEHGLMFYAKQVAKQFQVDVKKLIDFYKQEYGTEGLTEITRRDLLKGIGATAAAGALGAKVDVAKAAGGSTAREKILAMDPGEQFWYVKVKDPKKPTDRQEYVFSLDTFKSVDDARETIRQHFREYGYETDINIEVTLAKRK